VLSGHGNPKHASENPGILVGLGCSLLGPIVFLHRSKAKQDLQIRSVYGGRLETGSRRSQVLPRDGACYVGR
jgi:hypothetical protein